MSKVRADKTTNRLTLILSAKNREEFARDITALEAAAIALEPDFTCLTDFRKIWPLLPGNIDLLVKGQKHLLKFGVGKTARIIDPGQLNSPTFKILNGLTTGYNYEYATSLQAGEQILNTFKRELEQGTKYALKRNAGFKYVDPSGWEQSTTALDFDSVIKKLKKIRQNGRQKAIIVDSGFKQRS